MSIAENLKFLRKKAGYTQEQFAQELGIKRSLVGAYEEGRAEPRLQNLSKISSSDVQNFDLMSSCNLQS